jgi:hypothetical protein
VTGLTGGLTSWDEALAGPLGHATCLWQDLDGLHVQSAPPAPPLTSIVWGWTPDGLLLRVRLDGDATYLACWRGDTDANATQPWAANDDPVAAYRGAGPDAGGLGAAYAQIILHPDDDGFGPLTFIRPVPDGDG